MYVVQPGISKNHAIFLWSNNVYEYTALLVAMYVKVEMRSVSDLVLVRHHSVKDSWAYLNAWEVKCLN